MQQWAFARRAILSIAALIVSLGTALAQSTTTRIDEALQNISTLTRTGRVGYATFWDGNKYVQCRRLTSRELRCEAAGVTMQPTLGRILTPERQGRLAAIGWVVDPSFGNYVRVFTADTPTSRITEQIERALIEGYNADLATLELQTSWIVDVPCPPRNGPSQNLAGMVNDAPPMRGTSVRTCSYIAPNETTERTETAEELIAHFGPTATAEIQRLRLNATRHVHVVFDTGLGYIQCTPDSPPPAIYCEAQSADSFAPLAALLTPDRVARLHAAGFADPGRSPNYARIYLIDQFKDAAIAADILTLLHEVYGYRGARRLKILTE
jgi:hypothetical protein